MSSLEECGLAVIDKKNGRLVPPSVFLLINTRTDSCLSIFFFCFLLWVSRTCCTPSRKREQSGVPSLPLGYLDPDVHRAGQDEFKSRMGVSVGSWSRGECRRKRSPWKTSVLQLF